MSSIDAHKLAFDAASAVADAKVRTKAVAKAKADLEAAIRTLADFDYAKGIERRRLLKKIELRERKLKEAGR